MNAAEQPGQSPIDKVISEISTAMHSWSEEQMQTIRKKVHDRLDKHRNEVLMKLMGFDKGWDGEWKIDHCNGRSGNSPISDFLATSQKAALEEWMDQITLPVMTPAFKRQIEADLRRTYQQAVKDSSWRMARDKAERDLAELMEHALGPTFLDQFMQMQKLIEQPNQEAKTP